VSEQDSDILYLARINVGSVTTDTINRFLGVASLEGVTIRGLSWRMLPSRVGLIYLIRGLQEIPFVALNVRFEFPKLIGIWAHGKYAGHVLTFTPNRTRLAFLSGQKVRELSYSVEPGFRNRGFGTLLVALCVQAGQKDLVDIVGLVRQNNGSSLRVFDKFRSDRTLVRRKHKFFLASYTLSLSEVHLKLDFDKCEERIRYDLAAQATSMPESAEKIDESDFGEYRLPPALRTPYTYYDSRLRELITEGASVLELGAGTGNNTLVPLKAAGAITALDISGESLKVLRRRLTKFGFPVQPLIGDIESLPFRSGSFDFVISAGSLSYGNNTKVMGEILRVLKPGSIFVCVDSLNNNPIYRVNRFIHYLRGNRSKSTMLNMPSIRMIESYRANFASVETKFYGAGSFLARILDYLCGEARAQAVLDLVDRLIGVKRSAFKFVMIAKKGGDDGRKH
jgi:ubiquinone/menaquinone biosynthesis C-methylase UbiE